jgi:hypothetical protein
MLIHIIGTHTPGGTPGEAPGSHPAGGSNGEQRRRFTECFVLSQMVPGEYYVSNQVYREQPWEGYVPGWPKSAQASGSRVMKGRLAV